MAFRWSAMTSGSLCSRAYGVCPDNDGTVRSRPKGIRFASTLTRSHRYLHRCSEAVRGLKRIAIFAMRGQQLRGGQQDPFAARTAVLHEVLQHALWDFLVVGIIAQFAGAQRQSTDQSFVGAEMIDIGLGPGDALRSVQRANRLMHFGRDLC